MSRSEAYARARARAGYTDQELLEWAVRWHCRNPEIAWQYREAWAIRCVESVDQGDGGKALDTEK